MTRSAFKFAFHETQINYPMTLAFFYLICFSTTKDFPVFLTVSNVTGFRVHKRFLFKAEYRKQGLSLFSHVKWNGFTPVQVHSECP